MLFRTFAVVPLFALSGCPVPFSLQSTEAAPLVGGETILYRKDGASHNAILKITFEAAEGGYLVKAGSPAYPPQRVGYDLRSPFTSIKAYDLEMLWLPPSKRAVGSKLYDDSKVTKMINHAGRSMTLVASSLTLRYFDTETGFLIGIRYLNERIFLVKSTIPGLERVEGLKDLIQPPVDFSLP